MIFSCCSPARKNKILGNPGITLNGIDYLEVVAQKTLMIHCLKAIPAALKLTPDNVMIVGGESVTRIGVVSLTTSATDPNVLVVTTDVVGDFSPYVLRLVGSALGALGDPFEVTEVLPGFDPQLAEVQFTFQADSGPSFDCAPQTVDCPISQSPPPPINYLAKDYGSFRTLILDRLNHLLPTPVGGNEADLTTVLAELIAYRADQLSYQQDAIATETYLETARSRVSLRRHARLVGYHIHDGCNARAWLHVTVAANPGLPVLLDHNLTRFYTHAPGMPTTLAVGAGNEAAALTAGVQVFQPMQDALLYAEHNSIDFYTWGDTQCCLPAGAVEATLQGSLPNLQPGDVLIFQEVVGPQTGNAADADLRHRWAVRLTQVAHVDSSGKPLVDPLFDNQGNLLTSSTQTPMPVTQVRWAAADALPFPLCISSVYLDSTGTEQTAPKVSVALGNIVLADHGLSVPGADVGTMPAPRYFYPPSSRACQPPAAPVSLPVRFRPPLPDSPLTQAVPLSLTGSPNTPGVVLLGDSGAVNLADTDGLVSLSLQATNSATWPPLFGVLVQHNATTAANIDLSIVYSSGGSAPVVPVEHFTNLSLAPADPNYVATRINGLSNLVRVPAQTPPTGTLSGFPTTPTPLGAGAVALTDLGSPPVIYLTLQTTPVQNWLAAVGVLVQGLETMPPTFNVEVVYSPSFPIGVTLPVILEQFANVPQINLAPTINADSRLITAQSFAGVPDISLSAQDLLAANPHSALPQIALQGTYEGDTTPWTPRQDLLTSGPTDQVFVVEIESNGTAYLRFATPGDPGSPLGTNGLVPPAGTAFAATYRIGNGSVGNVGAESLKYLAAADARIQTCTNPLPASGGTDPETNEQIRVRAPEAFLSQAPGTLSRAITMADYEAIAENNTSVNDAAASLRWTGSWYSVFIAVEPRGGGTLTPTLQQAVTNTVETVHLAGQDVQLESPQYVSLQIALTVEVDDNYFRSDVEESLLQVLGNQLLPDGRKGLFFPDNFTFGETVYLSPVYAAARSVAGVRSVTATQFQPQGPNTSRYLSAGEIKLGSLQVARMENNPSYPSHGQLTLTMRGGR